MAQTHIVTGIKLDGGVYKKLRYNKPEFAQDVVYTFSDRDEYRSSISTSKKKDLAESIARTQGSIDRGQLGFQFHSDHVMVVHSIMGALAR